MTDGLHTATSAGPEAGGIGPRAAHSLTFNAVLRSVGIDPADVLLMRHNDSRSTLGRTIYGLWRDNRAAFEAYQSYQGVHRRQRLDRRYWASFVAPSRGGTLFVGLYRVLGFIPNTSPLIEPHNDRRIDPGEVNVFDLSLAFELSDLIGRLTIEWGAGYRMWVQRAEKQEKAIVELSRVFEEPAFPGFSHFIAQLSEIETMPATWQAALSACRGIYLLTCPRTSEQYVGAAVGAGGFLARWLEYARTGHGGNVGLKSRDPSDYRVSILEAAGSAATTDDILNMEARWKAKLQSREMGLNRN